VTFQVATNPLYRRYSGLAFSVTISATHGGVTQSVTLTVTAQPQPTDAVFSPDSDIKGLSCAGETGILFDCPLPSQGVCKFKQECTLGCLTRPIKGANWDDTCATIGPFPIALNPKSVVGGNNTAGTLLLTAPAVEGSTASVASNSLVARASNNVPQTIPTGATSLGFDVLTAQVNAIQFAFMDAHIRTIESGSSVFTTRHAQTWAAVVPGTPPPIVLTSLSLDRSTTTGGLAVFGTVTINQLAPAPEIGVITVSLTSSNPAVASVLQPSLTFVQGSSSAGFAIQTNAVAADTTITISAALGDTTLTTQLTVTATPAATSVTSFFLDPCCTVIGGNSATGTVVLNGVAPSGGAVVSLLSGNSAVVILPASVTVAAGTDRASFTVGTDVVAASATVTLSATYGSGSAFTSLIVLPAVTLASLTLNPTSVVGGNTSTGTVTLSAAPSANASVTLTSSNTAVATVPASVTVPAGTTSASFAVTTNSVGASTAVTISGSFGGVTQSANLTVSPAATGDTVTIQRAEFDSGKSQLRVEVTSTSATATLQVFVTSTNALIGTLTNNGGGRYSGQFTWPSNPVNITVRSSLGGSATSTVVVK
jgi:hypothetical protein